MGPLVTLQHASSEQLQADFDANLRKGRAFVAGAPALRERELCTLRIEPPSGGDAWCTRAEAVWLDATGAGLAFLDFDAIAQDALRAFVSAALASPAPGSGAAAPAPDPAPGAHDDGSEGSVIERDGAEPDSEGTPGSTPAIRNLHDRIRQLDLAQRDALARQGSLPERVALERRYGSSVWEGLLHNPQVTPREVRNMAKSTNLPPSLLNLIVSNRAWTADPAINQALLANPRLSGAQLERVLRALPQAELARVAEQTALRMQVRQAAKRLIRR